MAADSDESTARSDRRFAVLWFCAALLVTGSVGALVLTDDPRLLRLGLVAALWAALFGAFAASRQRLRAIEGRQRLEEQRQRYEAELDREVAERREFELELQSRQQQEEAAGTSSQVQALRAEVHGLRQALDQVLGSSGARGAPAVRLAGGRLAEDVRGLPAGAQQQAVPDRPVSREQPVSPPQQQFPSQQVPAQQFPGQAWPTEQPRRAPQQAVPAIGPTSSYGNATHYSGTFSPGEVSAPAAAPKPAPPAEHPPGAHSEGTAVVDLLAAYGTAPGGAEPSDARNRRRRRS